MSEAKCTHEKVKCLECGKEGTPAQLMASRPRTRSPEAQEQSRAAGMIAAEKRKAKKGIDDVA